jgi:hypothetical protein
MDPCDLLLDGRKSMLYVPKLSLHIGPQTQQLVAQDCEVASQVREMPQK